MNASRLVTPSTHPRWALGMLAGVLAFGATEATAQEPAPQPQSPPPSGWTEAPTQPNTAPPAPDSAPSPPTDPSPSPATTSADDPAEAPATVSSPPSEAAPKQPSEPASSGPQHPAPIPGTYPPNGYGYPPPGHAGYPPPPDCVVPDERPAILPYHEGQPAPAGYYYEERLRRGPIIAGAIVFGVPYALGLSVAGGDNFQNQTGWLAVPVIGPWVTLAARDRCDATVTYNDTFDDFESTCDGERTIRTLLVMDALMQATGATLFIWGLNSKTKRYVRNDISLQVLPTRVGKSGYGLGAVGSF